MVVLSCLLDLIGPLRQIAREMRDLCEDHCTPIANMDDLNLTT
jgi:hypothetical protein